MSDHAAESHDADAERYVIGAALRGKHWALRLDSIVNPSVFYRPVHSIVWTAIKHVLDLGEAYDEMVVAQHLADAGQLSKLDGGAAYLSTCSEYAVIPANSVHQAERMVQFAHKRAAAIKLQQALERLKHPGVESVCSVIESAASDLSGLSAMGPSAQSRIVKGGSFLLDIPEIKPSIWGRGKEILWARGESLVIAGPQGTAACGSKRPRMRYR